MFSMLAISLFMFV